MTELKFLIAGHYDTNGKAQEVMNGICDIRLINVGQGLWCAEHFLITTKDLRAFVEEMKSVLGE